MQQDVPYFEVCSVPFYGNSGDSVLVLLQPGRHRVPRVNDYVVPTDKKRTALRWQVRHALALQ